jgi:hypothetical protein
MKRVMIVVLALVAGAIWAQDVTTERETDEWRNEEIWRVTVDYSLPEFDVLSVIYEAVIMTDLSGVGVINRIYVEASGTWEEGWLEHKIGDDRAWSAEPYKTEYPAKNLTRFEYSAKSGVYGLLEALFQSPDGETVRLRIGVQGANGQDNETVIVELASEFLRERQQAYSEAKAFSDEAQE